MDRTAWRNQVIEDAIEPELPIVDCHHHIWTDAPRDPWDPYNAAALLRDKTQSGHRIIGTVYVDSHAHYREDGPEHLRVVGETEYAGALADRCDTEGGAVAGTCAGIVTHADLLLGATVGEVLDAHIAASPHFRGIRHMTAFDVDLPPIYGATEPGLMTRPAFRAGIAELARRDLSFDAWMFHPQLGELADLAGDFPDARIILDHTGGPIGVGRYADDRAAAFAEWRGLMARIARHPNVMLKIGALNMTFTALDAINAPRPNTSEETARIQRDHVLAAIDLFGPDRCMFESNFPVDMLGISYTVLWNSFKRMSAGFSASERADLFAGTAIRTYRLDRVRIDAG